MSMLADLRRVSPEALSQLRADPSDIFWHLYGSEPYQPPPSLLARVFGRARPARRRSDQWVAPAQSMVFRLDQSWHAVHFILTGSPDETKPPGGYLLSGGMQLGAVDVGYGPARALLPEMAADFARSITALSEATARERCTPEAMEAAKIYGAVRCTEEFSALWSVISDLRRFLTDTAAAKDSLIVYTY